MKTGNRAKTKRRKRKEATRGRLRADVRGKDQMEEGQNWAKGNLPHTDEQTSERASGAEGA